MFKIIALLSVLFSTSAFAIDTAKCPQRIDFKMQIIRVYKTSIYSKNPDWQVANRTLNMTESVESRYKLVAKSENRCVYRDNDQGSAVLTTSEFRDPEQNSPLKTDQFIVTHKDGNATFVSFIPVQSFSPTSFVLFADPFNVRIKARLYFAEHKRWANIDMGMVAVSAK